MRHSTTDRRWGEGDGRDRWGLRRWGLPICLVLGLCLLWGTGCRRAPPVAPGGLSPGRAEPLHAWDRAFQQADPRWKGADGAGSVSLSPSRILWLFGDTWIVPAGAQDRREGRIIRNSLAIQEIEDGKPGRIAFFWRGTATDPRAAFPLDRSAGWLWPLSGVRLGETLFVFLVHCVPSDEELGFELAGSELLRVSNPEEPPDAWRMRWVTVPFFRHTGEGDTFFGAACTLVGDSLYVYGVREDWARGPEGRSLIVACIPREGMERMDFSAWRFHGPSGWTPTLSPEAGLFAGAASEMSVHHEPFLERFLAVYTHCGLSRRVLARTAPRPEGPWGPPWDLYTCPEMSWSERYFCYAAKAHPELSPSAGELVVTYAANSRSLEDHREDERLYWPRFVRVSLEGMGR